MNENYTVFDDIMQGLHEVEANLKGNLKLKSTIITIPDDNINDMYSLLAENDKYFVKEMIQRLLLVK